MTNTMSPTPATAARPGDARGGPKDVATCSCRLYDAECALHAARRSGVAAWIEAASDKLHLAVADYLASVATDGDRAET